MKTTKTTPGNGAVAQRLSALAELYQQGQASLLTTRILEKVLAYEADQCQAQITQLQSDLAEFEKRYGMSSAEFYQRYQSGQTDDRMDYVEWASLFQMLSSLKQRLQLLTGEAQP